MKTALAGWKSRQITHRVDGWIVDPANKHRNKHRIPPAVAAMMTRTAPQPGQSLLDVRARMFARQRMHAQMSKCINE